MAGVFFLWPLLLPYCEHHMCYVRPVSRTRHVSARVQLAPLRRIGVISVT